MRFCALLLLLGLAVMTLAQPLKTSLLSIQYRPGSGMSIIFKGVPIIRADWVQLAAPDWSKGYYTSNGTDQRVEIDPDGKLITVTHHSDGVKFDAVQTIRVIDENRLELTVSGKLDNNIEAILEWSVANLNAFPFYGGSYSSGEANAASTAILPQPGMTNEGEPRAISNQGVIRLDSRLGTVTFKVEEGPQELNLLDGRRMSNRSWNEAQPTFWLGFLEYKIIPSQPFKIRVSVQFDPKEAHQDARSLALAVPVAPVKEAFAPQSEPIWIIPKPKSFTLAEAPPFALSPKTKLLIADESCRRAAQVVQQEVKERFGWDWAIILAPKTSSKGILFKMVSPKPDDNPESYRIKCRSNILLSAIDRPGLFYAAQTLIQMFQIKNSRVTVPASDIYDYPSLAFRGVHLFPGVNAMPFHKKLVERILSRFKLNYLVLESSYSQWAANPKLWIDISVPKKQLEEYVSTARNHFLEPIPLVQSLGHSEWMFKNNQNTDLAEDPKALYAYAVTEPKTYDFIGKVYDEALAIFQSRFFHIGHDEVTIFGHYPSRPEAKKLGVTNLFLQDIERHDRHFQPKGIRLMLWGDMLLARSESNDAAANAEDEAEALHRRSSIPKDSVICDWHYEAAKPEQYKSLEVFKKAGFTTIACSWYNPDNIYNLAQAARLYGAWGLLQTTWAGYSINEHTLTDAFNQFSAYILAAEYSWSADSPAPADLPYHAEEVFMREWDRGREEISSLPGFDLDLSNAGNLALSDKTNGWLGYGEQANLKGLTLNKRMKGITFHAGADTNPVLILNGALLTEKSEHYDSVSFTLNKKADQLAFLQATAFRAALKETVGSYQIIYADGSSVSVPLQYGVNIRAWEDIASTPGAPMAWSGKTQNGFPAALRLLRWTNPHPEKTIARIIFSTAHPYASPFVAGITGIVPHPQPLSQPLVPR